MITDRLGRPVSIGNKIAIATSVAKLENDELVLSCLTFATVVDMVKDQLHVKYVDGKVDRCFSKSKEFVIISSTLSPIVNWIEDVALGYVGI